MLFEPLWGFRDDRLLLGPLPTRPSGARVAGVSVLVVFSAWRDQAGLGDSDNLQIRAPGRSRCHPVMVYCFENFVPKRVPAEDKTALRATR